MEKDKIDLRVCKYGDTLISALGAKLKYIKPLPENNYMDHLVEYIEFPNHPELKNSKGCRTHDGYVYRKNRDPEIDHDIVKIIKQNDK